MAAKPPLNLLDRAILWAAPGRALRRIAARQAVAHYDAASPSRLRKTRGESASPVDLTQASAAQIRNQARYADKNHDIARGALSVLVNNTVGPDGIGVEPQPRRRDGTIHVEYAKALLAGYRDWCKRPEVTWRHSWSAGQRLVARTWFRDGEGFAQKLTGRIPGLDHGTKVPFSLELLEPDMLPLDYDDVGRGIRQSIERNAWGRPRGYWVYKQHPGDRYNGLIGMTDVKRIDAGSMLHLFTADRIGQIRGISAFASVLTRLDDIKDYEESERIAAKVAASITGVIKKGSPELYNPSDALDADGNPISRDIRMSPGMFIDSLATGESIELLDPSRPNPNVVTFRQGQLKAVAAGIGAAYSSIARSYDGTYSAQRQELVEQWVNYACLTDEFVGQFVRPVYEAFVAAATLSGAIPVPTDVVPDSANDALFVGTQMPWVDPMKEASAWLELVEAGFASEVEVMRARGVNPDDTLEQLATFREKAKARGLTLKSDFANAQQGGAPGAAAAGGK